MKDRLARIKTEKEYAKLQVDIKAAEVAAAIPEAGSEVDDASMVLSSLAPLNRTRDLFLNRPDEVSSQPSNAVGTAQATSQPSASRIHKDHLKLTSHPLRYSNLAPNLHSQANMSIGNRQSCVKQDCELLHSLREHLGVVRCLHINGQRLVSGGDQKMVVIWDYRAGKKLAVAHRHPTRLQRMLVTDTRIITASPETPGTITVLSFW
ncbi:hypothetical protein ACOMHN_018434 [Nucella lapillus]